MNTAAFAAHHAIPLQYAEAYAEGREARRDGQPLDTSRAIDPAAAWYRAGWHDEDMAREGAA